MTPSKPSSADVRSRSPTSGLPLTPPAPAGLRLIPSRPAVSRSIVAQHRVGAAEQEMPERRRLGVLEVGLVDHEGLGVRVGHPGDGGDELRRRLDECGHVAAHPQPQRDPHGLAAGPSGVQPARVAPDRGGEPAFAAVVDLAVRGVVAELRPGGGDRIAQHPEQRPGGRVGDDAALAQDEHVRDVGDVQPVVQQRRVGHLDGEPAVDQLGRVAAHWLTHPAGSASSACCRPPVWPGAHGCGGCRPTRPGTAPARDR